MFTVRPIGLKSRFIYLSPEEFSTELQLGWEAGLEESKVRGPWGLDGGERGSGGQVHTSGHAARDQRVLRGSQLTAPGSPASSLPVHSNLATPVLWSGSPELQLPTSRCSVLSGAGRGRGSR